MKYVIVAEVQLKILKSLSSDEQNKLIDEIIANQSIGQSDKFKEIIERFNKFNDDITINQ